jgi:hypothetical protein
MQLFLLLPSKRVLAVVVCLLSWCGLLLEPQAHIFGAAFTFFDPAIDEKLDTVDDGVSVIVGVGFAGLVLVLEQAAAKVFLFKSHVGLLQSLFVGCKLFVCCRVVALTRISGVHRHDLPLNKSRDSVA